MDFKGSQPKYNAYFRGSSIDGKQLMETPKIGIE
jgi:hypothetical protein